MHPSSVYSKTELGTAELKTSRGALPSHARRLLILIDGQRSVGDLAELLGAQAVDQLLPTLESQGLVRHQGITRPASLDDEVEAEAAPATAPAPASTAAPAPASARAFAPALSEADEADEAEAAAPSLSARTKIAITAMLVLALGIGVWLLVRHSGEAARDNAQLLASAAADASTPPTDAPRAIEQPSAPIGLGSAAAPTTLASVGPAPASASRAPAETPAPAPVAVKPAPPADAPVTTAKSTADASRAAARTDQSPAARVAAAPEAAAPVQRAVVQPSTDVATNGPLPVLSSAEPMVPRNAASDAPASNATPSASIPVNAAPARPSLALADPNRTVAEVQLHVRDRVLPDMPLGARRAGIESGKVVARLHVTADGKVERVELVSATSPQLFDQNVRRVLEKWTFDPPGRASEMSIELDFR